MQSIEVEVGGRVRAETARLGVVAGGRDGRGGDAVGLGVLVQIIPLWRVSNNRESASSSRQEAVEAAAKLTSADSS